MTDQWYYRMFGEEFGPVAVEKLREMADKGTVGASDEVRSARSSRWVSAGSVEELGLSLSSGDTATVVATASDSDAMLNVSSQRTGLDDWYCLLNGSELGPLNFDELLKYAKHEQLSADDEVKLGANGKWRRVGSIGRLMAVLPYRLPAQITALPATASPASRSKTSATKRPVAADRAGSNATATASVTPAPKPVGTKSQPKLPVINPPTPSETSSEVEPTAEKSTLAASPVAGRPAPSTSSVGSNYSSAMSMSSSSSYGSSRPAAISVRPTIKPSRSRNESSFSFAEMLEPLKEPKALGAVGVIASMLLCFGWMSLPRSSAADVKNFHELKHIVDEIKQKRSSNSTDFASVNTKADRIGKAVVAELAKKASRDEPAKQQLLWAARDRMPVMLGELKKAPAEPSKAEQGFIECLREAARLLNIKEDGLPPAPPRPPVDPNAGRDD